MKRSSPCVEHLESMRLIVTDKASQEPSEAWERLTSESILRQNVRWRGTYFKSTIQTYNFCLLLPNSGSSNAQEDHVQIKALRITTPHKNTCQRKKNFFERKMQPKILSVEIGHHFGGPTSHFWPCLYESGLTCIFLAPTCALTCSRVGLVTERLRPTQEYTLPSRFSIGMVWYSWLVPVQ